MQHGHYRSTRHVRFALVTSNSTHIPCLWRLHPLDVKDLQVFISHTVCPGNQPFPSLQMIQPHVISHSYYTARLGTLEPPSQRLLDSLTCQANMASTMPHFRTNCSPRPNGVVSHTHRACGCKAHYTNARHYSLRTELPSEMFETPMP
jgi:hypothetical protein